MDDIYTAVVSNKPAAIRKAIRIRCIHNRVKKLKEAKVKGQGQLTGHLLIEVGNEDELMLVAAVGSARFDRLSKMSSL